MPRVMMALGMALAQIAAGRADPPDSPMGVAAAADNAAEVRRLLSAGRGVDEVGPGGVTPLIAAARHGAVGARWSARFDLCREVLDLIDSKARTTPAK
ncbi:MAG: hypothetical protein A3H97_00630 [Acidobacteria bacterium RIFCSPLOWO2_02_FULL_65_29]|nr:MAG: hypothetical protein A3H97_00630 [Acidobacteria bacterium RIFCSPLOWO2_02_FULL_65_29]